MRRSTFEQYAIVKEDSASLFNEKLNAEIYRLRNNNPVVKFSESIPFYAQIKYTVDSTTPECLKEEYEAQGVSFVCAQCPYFNAPTKDDGTTDRRCKWGECEHSETGRVSKMSPACEKLYETIKEGDVKLCFMD